MRETKDFQPLKYKICDLDRIVDEKGSAFLALRKIAWGVDQEDNIDDDSKIKLDLRKYYTTAEGERLSKGVSFLTEDGPNELVRILLEEGYGDSGQCLKILKGRDDFKEAVYFAYDEIDKEDSEFSDPRELLGL